MFCHAYAAANQSEDRQAEEDVSGNNNTQAPASLRGHNADRTAMR